MTISVIVQHGAERFDIDFFMSAVLRYYAQLRKEQKKLLLIINFWFMVAVVGDVPKNTVPCTGRPCTADPVRQELGGVTVTGTHDRELH
jgi:hypothetical protein